MQVYEAILQPRDGCAIYTLFGHAGYYIGKARLLRQNGGGLALRAVEHIAGLVLPHSQDGGLSKYNILRQSLGSISMFPIAIFNSEDQAVVVESSLISALHPKCNGADEEAFRVSRNIGTRLGAQKAFRKRPPPSVRGQAAIPRGTRVWDMVHFTTSVEKRLARQAGLRAASEQKLPRTSFGRLYRVMQCRSLLQSGQVGPVDLFASDQLFCAYLAVRVPKVSFPWHWKQYDIAKKLYAIIPQLDKYLAGFGNRNRGKTNGGTSPSCFSPTSCHGEAAHD